MNTMRRPNSHRGARLRRASAAAGALAVLVACSGPRGQRSGQPPEALPEQQPITTMSTGPMAGEVVSNVRGEIHNPYANDANAIAAGKQLYIHMNCAYCHGFDGGGGMGPNLADDYWRFGGDDADVYKSIYEGRGKGMPAWGAALPESDIWKIIAYVRTLGGGESVAQRGGEAGGAHAAANAQGGQGGGRAGAQRQPAGASAQREPLKGRNITEP